MDNLRGKRLLVLGGSRISCEIVRRAQEFGIYVLVTDWYPVENHLRNRLPTKHFW